MSTRRPSFQLGPKLRAVAGGLLVACVGLICVVSFSTALATTNPIQIVEWTDPESIQRLGDRAFVGTTGQASRATNIFLALPPDTWAPGFVPVYLVEKEGKSELRRQPPRGEENQTEPFFFALPPDDEPAGSHLTGQWRCLATRVDSSDAWFIWQLTVVGESIVGRFDPSSDYRVVSVRSGTFRSNHFELTVDYINDAYHLKGEWRGDKLRGSWEKHDREERGQWEAERDRTFLPQLPPGRAMPLYEWRRSDDRATHYSTSSNAPALGWTRSPRPLCLVWPCVRSPISSTNSSNKPLNSP